MREPTGKPIPGVSTPNDAVWALTRARRYIFRGGQWTSGLHVFVNRWLDVLREGVAGADTDDG